MSRSVSFRIERDVPGEPLLIRDVGRQNDTTITNAAEEVVAILVKEGRLAKGRRLFYYDSEGEMDEIVVQDGRFAGFKPGPR